MVSHRQGALVQPLLADLTALVRSVEIHVTLTQNVPEDVDEDWEKLPFPVHVIRNRRPLGFAANHNQASREEREFESEYFCVLNPDLRLTEDPFPALLECLAHPALGAVAPLVRNPAGDIEDNCRKFPTPWSIFQKALGTDTTLYCSVEESLNPDWIAGMFMVFPRRSFEHVGGFDQRFHLYYEDVDICARLRLAGYRVALCPAATVIHDARRESHRNLGHMGWHLTSMLRFFSSRPYRQIRQECHITHNHG